ncbi:unnamed protein product [Camellia sinensis]
MELGFSLVVLVCVFGVVALRWFLRGVNFWLYEAKLGDKRFSLPPGDLGWPFIGNMWSFLRAFKSTDPDSFTANYVSSWLGFTKDERAQIVRRAIKAPPTNRRP